MKLPPFIVNWRTTLAPVVLTLAPYALQAYGVWPAWLPPLPPFADVWPQIAGLCGLGALAKDGRN
jgi:hypothetical protein